MDYMGKINVKIPFAFHKKESTLKPNSNPPPPKKKSQSSMTYENTVSFMSDASCQVDKKFAKELDKVIITNKKTKTQIEYLNFVKNRIDLQIVNLVFSSIPK